MLSVHVHNGNISQVEGQLPYMPILVASLVRPDCG